MKNIKFQSKVRYIGKPNTWTFEQDLDKNCQGSVIDTFKSKEKIYCMVDFENGIMTPIELEDLQEII
jgi:hypothetical protein